MIPWGVVWAALALSPTFTLAATVHDYSFEVTNVSVPQLVQLGLNPCEKPLYQGPPKDTDLSALLQQDPLPQMKAIAGALSGNFQKKGDHATLPGPLNTPCVDDSCKGAITFKVRCTKATPLIFDAYVLAPDAMSDSFLLAVDQQGPHVWHTGNRLGWRWSNPSPGRTVAAGDHVVSLNGHDDGIQVRDIRIKAPASSACTFVPLQSTQLNAAGQPMGPTPTQPPQPPPPPGSAQEAAPPAPPPVAPPPPAPPPYVAPPPPAPPPPVQPVYQRPTTTQPPPPPPPNSQSAVTPGAKVVRVPPLGPGPGAQADAQPAPANVEVPPSTGKPLKVGSLEAGAYDKSSGAGASLRGTIPEVDGSPYPSMQDARTVLSIMQSKVEQALKQEETVCVGYQQQHLHLFKDLQNAIKDERTQMSMANMNKLKAETVHNTAKEKLAILTRMHSIHQEKCNASMAEVQEQVNLADLDQGSMNRLRSMTNCGGVAMLQEKEKVDLMACEIPGNASHGPLSVVTFKQKAMQVEVGMLKTSAVQRSVEEALVLAYGRSKLASPAAVFESNDTHFFFEPENNETLVKSASFLQQPMGPTGWKPESDGESFNVAPTRPWAECAVGATVDTADLCAKFADIQKQVQMRKAKLSAAFTSVQQKCTAQDTTDAKAFQEQQAKLQESGTLLQKALQDYKSAEQSISVAQNKFDTAVREYKVQITLCNSKIATYQKEICGTGEIGNEMYTIAVRNS
eukprot:gnl/TRDRNA2_/TRDRNA2_35429_c0_seq1.p1 gnl/TRDRNA2_/TRDRNA2_35429_c0~~gnl/TRDRNA2_/TRDRNA2_35429_c0_seq1.p1  ORF type:complete len:736 (-),score=171.72 gnl/TRDRNA2_/TRDRNA2_35429_c0_seq1:142-2349(-)